MKKKNLIRIFTVLFNAFLFLLTLPFSGHAQNGEQSLNRSQLIELKRIGVMIAQGKSDSEVQEAWKMMFSNNRDINVDMAINSILSEAKLETERNVTAAKITVQFYSLLGGKLFEEIKNARLCLSKTVETKEPVNIRKKVFGLSPDPQGEIVFSETDSISTLQELENYIKEYEEQLNTIGDDAQLANIDLQNVLQKQQQTLQMLSTISKMLHDTAMAVIRKIGG